MIPIAINGKKFTPTLALTADQFTVLFNYVSLAVTCNADHFNLLKKTPMEQKKELLFRTAASYDRRVLRLYMVNKIRKRMTTTKMKEPNRSEFFKTSFMIGFRFAR
jgi:hypothetical protein